MLDDGVEQCVSKKNANGHSALQSLSPSSAAHRIVSKEMLPVGAVAVSADPLVGFHTGSELSTAARP